MITNPKITILSQNQSRGPLESTTVPTIKVDSKEKCPTCEFMTEPFYMKIPQCPNKS
jgi:hypothetical protein